MAHTQTLGSTTSNFADIIDPVSPETFFSEYYGREHLHISGTRSKFAEVMSWETLNSLLNMTAIWSSSSLKLVLDTDVVPPHRYCRLAQNRDGTEVLQPDSEKVMALVQDGASLVANDVDTLTPALAGVASALEVAVNGKAQANLYCSWRERQAFASHYDTHDVYAIHVTGEKKWRIYETRIDHPIAHPRFKSLGQKWHERNKGDVRQEIVMKPGDLLYIPRGIYHDAVATSDGTIHIAFGVTHVTGMDALDMLLNIAVGDAAFRRNMPRANDGVTAAAAWLADLGNRLAEFTLSEDAIEAMRRHQAQFHYPRGGIRLPVAPSGPRYRLNAQNLRVERRESGWILAGGKGAASIPGGMEEAVSWVVDRPIFSEGQLRDAFPALSDPARQELIEALLGMKVIIAI